MVRVLSVDLRGRVVTAIADDLSPRQATVRRQRCDRRSMRIEAHTELILEAYEATPDITLAELQALLADQDTEVALGKM